MHNPEHQNKISNHSSIKNVGTILKVNRQNFAHEKKRVFELDLVRGLAAIIVVIFHTPQFFGGFSIPHGYLAVDLFFMLSGWVMTHSYRLRILEGMSFRSFCIARFARLYPLYILSLLIALTYQSFVLLKGHSGDIKIACLVPNLIMVPCIGGGAIFPFDTPAWSIFWEIFANIFWFALLHIAVRREVVIYLISIVISISIIYNQNAWLGGFDSSNFIDGSIRALMGFYCGCLIYDFWESKKARYVIFATIITSTAFFIINLTNGIFDKTLGIDLLIVFTVAPLIILICSHYKFGIHEKSLGAWIGDISYSIYLLHLPLSYFFQSTIKRIGYTIPSNITIGVVFLLIIMLIGATVYKFFEIPSRRLLVSKLSSGL
jgi:peptidoglycan/LPS O-acetylase OafA/YrhL